MEAQGEGPPSCSSIKPTFFYVFKNIFRRSPRRARNLRDAAYGSPRSSGRSPGGLRGRLWESWGPSDRPRGVIGMSLERSWAFKGYLEIIKKQLLLNIFVQSGGSRNGISIRSEILEGSRALSWGPHGSFAGCPGILWMLRTIQKQSLAQNGSLRLKREAPGGGPPPCSSIKLMLFNVFKNIFRRSPRRARNLRDAAYGSPRSSGRSPGGLRGRLWESWGPSDRPRGVIGMSLERS